jgi:Caspase domain
MKAITVAQNYRKSPPLGRHIRELYGAFNDALLVQNYFQSKGFEVLPLSDKVEPLTRARFISKVSHFSAGKMDKLIFHYSGHGLKEGLIFGDGLLTYGHLEEILSRSGAKRIECFFDCCYGECSRKFLVPPRFYVFELDNKELTPDIRVGNVWYGRNTYRWIHAIK